MHMASNRVNKDNSIESAYAHFARLRGELYIGTLEKAEHSLTLEDASDLILTLPSSQKTEPKLINCQFYFNQDDKCKDKITELYALREEIYNNFNLRNNARTGLLLPSFISDTNAVIISNHTNQSSNIIDRNYLICKLNENLKELYKKDSNKQINSEILELEKTIVKAVSSKAKEFRRRIPHTRLIAYLLPSKEHIYINRCGLIFNNTPVISHRDSRKERKDKVKQKPLFQIGTHNYYDETKWQASKLESGANADTRI